MKPHVRFAFIVVLSMVLLAQSGGAQDSSVPGTQREKYPNTQDGLKEQIADILRAAKSKDSPKEAELIQLLLIPRDSEWFVSEYGPGFGNSLGAAYARELVGLEQNIQAVYEANAEHGLMSPKLLKYENPDTTDAPIDRFLNSMNKIIPLYQTAFNGSSPMFTMMLNPGVKQPPGDLDGFFVYDQGAFRYVPVNILMKLPSERPVRIKLGTNIMNSKLLVQPAWRYPAEALQKHISGQVVIQIVVGIQGNIKELKALQGDPILSTPVMNDMKNWHFEPTKLDGDPVEVEVDWQTGFEYH